MAIFRLRVTANFHMAGLWDNLPRPPEISRLRPDACGIQLDTGEIAFGEAKTTADINTQHTVTQLAIFGSLLDRRRMENCRLYVAVPRSAAMILDRAFGRAKLLGSPHVFPMYIPDCMVGD